MTPDRWRERLAPHVEELQHNRRLRLGLWAILGIVLLYLVLLTGDALEAARAERTEAVARLAEVEDLAAERDSWSERVTQARALRSELDRRLWRSDTPGLAQASLQSWLENTARKAGIDNPRISMREVQAVDGADPLWIVAATLSAGFQPSALGRFLYDLESAVPEVQVEAMTIRSGRRRALEMTVRAVFQPGNAAGS